MGGTVQHVFWGPHNIKINEWKLGPFFTAWICMFCPLPWSAGPRGDATDCPSRCLISCLSYMSLSNCSSPLHTLLTPPVVERTRQQATLLCDFLPFVLILFEKHSFAVVLENRKELWEYCWKTEKFFKLKAHICGDHKLVFSFHSRWPGLNCVFFFLSNQPQFS